MHDMIFRRKRISAVLLVFAMAVAPISIGWAQDGMAVAAGSGERWAYSNSGYYLPGLIIEKVSGMKYATFLEQNIFEPLHVRRHPDQL
jgi:CubicO group peptidase (beta-lactamase class C family)